MSIYDEIKKKFIMRNAYEDWTEYRNILTGIIIQLGDNSPQKTVAIMGAGRCNDIDIHKLCASFKEIMLVDYDPAASGEALKKLSDPEIRKMYVREISFTGIKEKDISFFCDETVNALRTAARTMNADRFSGIIMKGLEKLKTKIIWSADELAELLPKRDILLCSGVFSQLFSNISFFIRSCAASMDNECDKTYSEAAERADEVLKGLSRDLVPVITEAMIKSAKDYAVFCNEYSETDPVEGACRCIEILRNEGKAVKGVKAVKELKTVWLFNKAKNVRYDMLVMTVKKEQE